MSTERETLLEVTGMSCHSCVSHIHKALGTLEGVRAVDVLLAEGRVRIRHDPGTASVDAMREVLGEAGYEASPAA